MSYWYYILLRTAYLHPNCTEFVLVINYID